MSRAALDAAVPRRLRRHTLAVRLFHWVNVVAFFTLLLSGLQIFNAHPALYWGGSSYTGAGPIFAPGPFPGWITLPDVQWLAMGRRWHLFFAWVLVLNGLAYVLYTIASRHLARDLWPTREELRGLGASLMDHLRLRHPTGEAAARYNVLQKLAYLAVVFVLLPFLVLMGLGLSPSLDTVVPGWVDFFGGRQAVRTLHFAAAALLVLFVAVHVFEILISGAWNLTRSMLTGWYRPTEPRR